MIVVIIVVIGIAWSLSRCSTPTGTPNSSAAPTAMAQSLSDAVKAQTPPPVQPLSRKSVKRGMAHERLAFAAEGVSGAMIYSQNCYDALSRSFSWGKLDSCGGFDMLAVQSLPETDVAGLEKETAYFQNEVAAGRYLAAATGAGEGADEADTRLSALQARIGPPAAAVDVTAPAATEESGGGMEGADDTIDNLGASQ